jgi:molybdenum cofactor cytidylyltransferase
MIAGIVLAAGGSTRMGRPKALLAAGDRTFIRRILDTLVAGGIHQPLVVVRPGDADVIAAVDAGAARAVPNPRADEGQLSSLLAGLEAADGPEVEAVLVTLVDVPLIAVATVRALLARAAVSEAPILRAVYRGRHGHPVVFKRATFEALRRADPSIGAKAVVRAFEVEDVEVDDPGIAEDIDTPADYARVLPADAAAREKPSEDLIWYHTIELPGGETTPGIYDHRPYLPAYGLPEDLRGKTALDVGAASGFFSFELERRGALVTATDLPSWKAHDFGVHYAAELGAGEAEAYLHEPFLFAHRARGSRVTRTLTSIYDISPASVGTFDFVFCGSVLIHLSDPATALRRLCEVTREAAIIATVVHPADTPDPIALFSGHLRGDTWWAPNRAGFEAMVQSAGFAGWEWYSEFSLDYRDGSAGPYHGVIRAWNTPDRPAMFSATPPSPRPPRAAPLSWDDRVSAADREIARLHGVVNTYQDMSFVRLVQWLHPYRERMRSWFR